MIVSMQPADLEADDPMTAAVGRYLGSTWFWVTRTHVVVRVGSGMARRLPLPAAAVRWLALYDGGYSLPPLSFEMPNP